MPSFECESCRQDYPLSSFPDISAGLICNSCTTGKDLSLAENAIGEKAKALASDLVSIDSPELMGVTAPVKAIIGEIYSCFGGTTSYAQHLHDVIIKLTERRPIPASVGHIMVNLMKLQHTVEQTEHHIKASEMTNEQLHREQELAMASLVMESMNDPRKRRMLERILGTEGLKLAEADPAEMLHQLANDVASPDVDPKGDTVSPCEDNSNENAAVAATEPSETLDQQDGPTPDESPTH